MGGSYDERRDELRRSPPKDVEAARAARVAIRQATDAATISLRYGGEEFLRSSSGDEFLKAAMHVGRADALIESATGGDKAGAMRIADLARVSGLLSFLKKEYVSTGDLEDDVARMRDRFEETLGLLAEWESAGPAGDKARDDEPVDAPPEKLDVDAKLLSASIGLQRALNDIGDVLRSKPKIAQGDFADAVDRAVRGLIVATTGGWAIPTDKVRFVARKGRAWLEGDSGAPIALIEAIGNAIKLGHFIDGIEQEGDA